MPCQTEMGQAQGARARAESRDREEDKVKVEEGDKEWEERWVEVDHLHVLQATVCVRNADTRLRIRSDSPAAGKVAPSAEQK